MFINLEWQFFCCCAIKKSLPRVSGHRLSRQSAVWWTTFPLRPLQIRKGGGRAWLPFTCSHRAKQAACSSHAAILPNRWASSQDIFICFYKYNRSSQMYNTCLCVIPQSLPWQTSLLTISQRLLGSRCRLPISWVSAPRCCSTPPVCTAPTSTAAHSASSLWTAAHTTPPPPTPTTVSPVIRYVSFPCSSAISTWSLHVSLLLHGSNVNVFSVARLPVMTDNLCFRCSQRPTAWRFTSGGPTVERDLSAAASAEKPLATPSV